MRAVEKTLEEFIFTNDFKKYSIPYYQRPYKWKKDQIEDFWNDLTDNKQNFIGPLVLQEEDDGTKTIVDGQQRLITSTIFACVLRDFYKKYDAENQYRKIKDRYINTEDDEGENIEYRLKTGPSTSKFLGPYLQDDDFVCQYKRILDISSSKLNKKNDLISDDFIKKSEKIYKESFKENAKNKIINKKISELETKTSEEQRIKDNYILLYSKENTKEKTELLSYLRDDLKKMQIVVITIKDLQNAYEVFERLNNFGIALTQADLLKNFILKNVKPKQVKICHDKWVDIEERIGEENITSFIRYFWMSKNPFTQRNKLYNTISSSDIDFNLFINELEDASYIYEIISNTNHSFEDLKTTSGVEISTALNSLKKTINIIGASQPITLIICFVSLLQDNKLKVNPSKFLSLLESFLFQYFAVGNNPGNAVERLFSKISNELQESTNKESKHIAKEQTRCFDTNSKNIKDIYNEYVNQDSFYESFMNLKYARTGNKFNINRYILEKYEYYLWETKMKVSSELNINMSNVNQEHLLPQKPKLWGLDQKDVDSYVNSLGNIFLIDIQLNRRMQNDILEDKMVYLKQSKLESVNSLVRRYNRKNFDWNEKEIRDRLKSIADAAWNEIWKV